jgi:hypothetical protein
MALERAAIFLVAMVGSGLQPVSFPAVMLRAAADAK